MNVSSSYGWIQATNYTNLAVNYPLLLNPNGGNVGIGTTSPTARLHIAAAASGESVFKINGQGGTNATVIFADVDIGGQGYGGAYLSWGRGGSYDNWFMINTRPSSNVSVERLRITANGGFSFGSGGTNYGTAGQILQSNGDTAPTWVNQSSVAAGSAPLTNTYVGFGNASNLLSGSSNLTWNGTTLYVNGKIKGATSSNIDIGGIGPESTIYFRASTYNGLNSISGTSNIDDTATGASLGYVVNFTAGWTGGSTVNRTTGLTTGFYDVYVRIRSDGLGTSPTSTGFGIYNNTLANYLLNTTLAGITTAYKEIYAGRIEMTTALLGNANGTYFSSSGVTTNYYVDYIKYSPSPVFMGGNVGIGTTAPNGVLTLGTTDPILSFYASDATYSVRRTGTSMILKSSGYSGVVSVSGTSLETSNGYVVLLTGTGSSAERLRVTANGGFSFGGSGTAYGTAGQVLKSNGDAVPTWVDQSSVSAGTAVTATYLNTAASSTDINLNTRVNSGFWQQSATTTANGWPVNSSWWHAMTSTHSNGSNYYSMQLAADFFAQTLYYRSTNNSGTTAWNQIIITVSGTTAHTGAITATGDITAFSSDRRLKTDVRSITNAVDKVKSLNGIIYKWNDLANTLAGYDTNTDLVGLFAQEVEAVLPYAVKPAPFDYDNEKKVSKSGEDYLTVQYEKLVPLLVEAIKEQQAMIDQLRAEMQELKNFIK